MRRFGETLLVVYTLFDTYIVINYIGVIFGTKIKHGKATYMLHVLNFITMCYKKIKIYTNSRVIGKHNFVRLFNFVNCGKCCECQRQKSSEWIVRSYYHSLETLRNGYILFDTLTYDDNNIPRVSSELRQFGLELTSAEDFTCFSRRDIQLFFKRLRKKLASHYPNYKFSYFLSSEYGVDNRFSHRPHYHLMLFSPSFQVPPVELSAYIYQCWQKGRTDGIFQNDYKTFTEKKLLVGYSSRVIRASQYISKYVEKNSSFQSVIDLRLKSLYRKLHDLEVVTSDVCKNPYSSLYKKPRLVSRLKEIEIRPVENYAIKLKFNRIRHYIEQFHLQSHGYGISGLEVNRDELLNHDRVRIPDLMSGERFVPAFPYYLNKLIRYKRVTSDGRIDFPLNDLGKQYILNRQQRIYDSMLTKYTDLTKNVSFDVDSLLAGRTLSDFVNYKLYYQNRITFKKRYPKLRDIIPLNVVDYVDIPAKDRLYMANTSHDVALYGNRLVSSFPLETCRLRSVDLTLNYFSNKIVNERNDKDFHDFDKLDGLFNFYIRKVGIEKQSIYDLSQNISSSLKSYKSYK